MSKQSRLEFFPVSFFSVVMGLAGFTIALEKAEEIFALPLRISGIMLAVTAAVFVVLAMAYGAKLIRFRPAVVKELNHPIKLSFFPAFSISLILLSIALLPISMQASFPLWAIGTAIHLGFTLFVLSRWINHTTFDIQHSNPSWFIPMVGNILVPIGGIAHGYAEVSWFFFSIGVLFWLVLLTIIFYRVIFHPALPEKLVPTFFILIAPPAVGFIAYFKLAGGLDSFGRFLFYCALFFTILLLSLYRKFMGIRFFLSWWAYSFPVAAFAIASMVMYKQQQTGFYLALSGVMLALLTLIIVVLVVKTLAALWRGQICVED